MHPTYMCELREIVRVISQEKESLFGMILMAPSDQKYCHWLLDHRGMTLHVKKA